MQRNWKTSLAGACGAAVLWGISIVQTGQLPDQKTFLTGLALAALGYLAKDAGVTGVAK